MMIPLYNLLQIPIINYFDQFYIMQNNKTVHFFINNMLIYSV